MNKSFLITILYLLTVYAANAQAPNWLWAKSIGDSGFDYCENIINDGSGNFYIAGSFTDTLDFDPGPGIFNLMSHGNVYGDIYIAKYDSSGNLIWAKSIGDSLGEDVHCLLADSAGYIYIGGSFMVSVDFDPGPGITIVNSAGSGDAYIAKFDSGGNFIWVKTFGGPASETVREFSISDLSHDIFCTGHFSLTADFDPGPGVYNMTSDSFWDIFLLHLDTSGNFVWAKHISGNTAPSIFSLKSDNLDNVFIAGQFSDTMDFDPDTSLFNLISVGDLDPFTAKYDSSGKLIWAKSFGGPSQDWCRAMSISKSNYDVYTVGYFTDSADFDPGSGEYKLTTLGSFRNAFVTCFDSSGLFKWVAPFYTDSESFCHKVFVDNSAGHEIYVAGSFRGTGDFDPGPSVFAQVSAGSMDGFLVCLDSLGNLKWAKSMGGSDYEGFGNCSVYNDYLYMVGAFASANMTFDTIILNAVDPYDICLSKLDLRLATSLQEHTLNDNVIIYPNPTNTSFTVSISNENFQSISQLRIYDLTGREVHQEIVGNQQTVKCQLTSGTYIVRINTGSKFFTQKLMVE